MQMIYLIFLDMHLMHAIGFYLKAMIISKSSAFEWYKEGQLPHVQNCEYLASVSHLRWVESHLRSKKLILCSPDSFQQVESLIFF